MAALILLNPLRLRLGKELDVWATQPARLWSYWRRRTFEE